MLTSVPDRTVGYAAVLALAPPGQRTAKVQLPAPGNRSFFGYTKRFRKQPRKQPRVSTNSDPVFRVVSLSRSNAIWNAKRTQARRLLSGSARLAALSARGSGELRGAPDERETT